MSQAGHGHRQARLVREPVEIDEAVRSRSQYAQTLHRPDPDADEERPACSQAIARDVEYTRVSIATHRPIYSLCRNPECFGGEWR